VLGLERVGVHDNFFELGGDSIISIQIIARASQAGLRLTVRQLFQRQTIAELAQVADADVDLRAEQGLVTGPAPLTPIQHWFFAQNLPEPHHFNQSVLLQVPPDFDPGLLEQALQHLLRHHDALRLRFEPSLDSPGASSWRQTIVAPGKTVPLVSVDSSSAAELQASLDLSDGPLLCAALFRRGAGQPGRLLLVIHHLAVDGVSWRILLQDLQTAYQQLERGAAPSLPPKSTSFKQWAERIADHAQTEAVGAELDYWLAQNWGDVAPLPVDHAADANTVGATDTVWAALDGAQTRSLLQDTPPVYNTRINDVLLTALARAFARWTGQRALLLNLEGHGREELFADLDVSRTVGWFTSMFPVLLELEDLDIGQNLKSVKEQLRRVPHHGIGYGLLRYLNQNAATRASLQALPQPQVAFNYLGQFDQAASHASLFSLAPEHESAGPDYSPSTPRQHLLEINGQVTDGRLRLGWTYNQNVHQAATIERLAQGFVEELQALIAHCQEPGAGGCTPSDFPDAALDQETLDHVLADMPGVQDIYPLTPAQQGMFFETLSHTTPGMHVEQSVWTLNADLDPAIFEGSWQRTINRHSALRTAFVWSRSLAEPLQVVLQAVRAPLERRDWRAMPPTLQREQLEAYLQEDRARGFDLAHAPLMRLALFQVGENQYWSVWTSHHILLDGWCVPLILGEAVAFFEALGENRQLQLEPVRPYRDYVRWLRQQDLAQAETFWKQRLQGVARPTPLGTRAGSGAAPGLEERYASYSASLPAPATATLRSLVRQHRLTLNALVQGTWALLLSRYSGEPDVIFGATVSGRPADLVGVESMIGLFINTVPVRLQVASQASLWSWLEAAQAQRLEQQKYEYCSSGQIRQWVNVPGSLPLYESILVFENYPLNPLTSQAAWQSLDVSDARSIGAQTRYPLAILVAPDVELKIQVVADTRRVHEPDVAHILEHWIALLENIAALPDQRLEALLNKIPSDQIPRIQAPTRPVQGADFVPARDTWEVQLAQVWEQVLGAHPISIRDNFFELGGHSLLALQLMARTQQVFGKNLPLATLFQKPTVEQLAEVLRQHSPALPWSALVPIQPQGDRRPFFCVPGAGGNVLYLHELARNLGPDQPFYGLQSVGLDGASEPYARIEDMAAHYIQAVRAIQPHGPYLVGGHSLGGPVAFEMAQQWLRQGEPVALVVILDTWPTLEPDLACLAWDDARWLFTIARLVEHLSGKTLGVSHEVLQTLAPDEQLHYLSQRMQAEGWLPPGELEIAPLRGMVRVYKASISMQYAPQNVQPVRVALLRSSEPVPLDDPSAERPALPADPTLGWDKFVKKGLKVYKVPGNHLTMLVEPHVQALAEQLRACLDQAQMNSPKGEQCLRQN
jgi:non-ribosomal peptide synthase protein (TIGR01720 family)